MIFFWVLTDWLRLTTLQAMGAAALRVSSAPKDNSAPKLAESLLLANAKAPAQFTLFYPMGSSRGPLKAKLGVSRLRIVACTNKMWHHPSPLQESVIIRHGATFLSTVLAWEWGAHHHNQQQEAISIWAWPSNSNCNFTSSKCTSCKRCRWPRQEIKICRCAWTQSWVPWQTCSV